jgi:hypothetical protein
VVLAVKSDAGLASLPTDLGDSESELWRVSRPSITMYEIDQGWWFVPNALNKFTVSLRNNPKYNPDGSLTLYFQNESLGADKEAQWLLLACAVQRRRFPVGESPTRQPLQPEATGAAMEVTKWLKPSDSVSRYTVTARVCRP